MSLRQVLRKYESEIEEIDRKVAALQERKEFVRKFLAELKPAGRATKAKQLRKAKRKARRKGGLTAKDAILKVVADASGPLTPAEIIASATKLSGGATSSTRTQLGALAKAGDLKKLPHKGRGFKYALAGK